MADTDGFMQVEVRGARDLTRAMCDAGVDLKDLNQANQRVAEIVLSAANPPRRTGRLASSGRAGRARSRARVTYSAPYAAPIHWGWPRRHIEANPWLSRAAQVSEPVWQAAYLAAVNQIVDQVEEAGA